MFLKKLLLYYKLYVGGQGLESLIACVGRGERY